MEVAPRTVGRAETIGSWRSALPRDGGRRARPLDPTPPSGLDGLFPRVASNLVQANSRSPFRGRSYLPTRTTAHDKAPESRGAAAFRTRARVAAPARARATAGETDARAFFGPNRLMLWASQKLSPAAGVRPQGSRASPSRGERRDLATTGLHFKATENGKVATSGRFGAAAGSTSADAQEAPRLCRAV